MESQLEGKGFTALGYVVLLVERIMRSSRNTCLEKTRASLPHASDQSMNIRLILWYRVEVLLHATELRKQEF